MKRLITSILFAVLSITTWAQTYGNFRQIRFFPITIAGDTAASVSNDGRIWYDLSTDNFRGIRNGTKFTFATGSAASGLTPLGTALQQIRVNAGATALEYFTPLFNPATTNGDLIYYNGTTFTRLGVGVNGSVFTSNGTIPGWTGNILNTTSTAKWHLAAGSATASTAPLKLTSGTVLTAAEAGAIEYDGTDFHATNGTAIRGVMVNENDDTWNIGTATTGGGTRSITAIGSSSTLDMIFTNKGGNRVFSFNTTSGNAAIQTGGSSTALRIFGGSTSTVIIGSDGSTTTGISLIGSATNASINAGTGGFGLGITSGDGDSGTNNAGSLTMTAGNGYATSGNGAGGNITFTAGQRRTAGSGVDGSIVIETRDATGTLRLNDGANEQMGVATLVGGTVTVNNTKVTANTRIFVNHRTTGGTIGILTYTIVANTSFTITSSSGTDTSTVNWLLIEPN